MSKSIKMVSIAKFSSYIIVTVSKVCIRSSWIQLKNFLWVCMSEYMYLETILWYIDAST